jgi:hypothetical protein
MSDTQNNRLLNFLKWNSACVPAKQWAVYLETHSGLLNQANQLVYAWDLCPDPFWMIWALHRASRKVSSLKLDRKDIRLKVKEYIKKLNDAGAIDSDCSQAYTDFSNFGDGEQVNVDIDKHQSTACKVIAKTNGEAKEGGAVSTPARSAQSFAAALKCFHPRCGDDMPALIQAAHNALEFAMSALNGEDKLDNSRQTLLTEMKATALLKLSNAQKNDINAYEAAYLGSPPSWSHDTPPRNFGGPVMNTPANNSTWYEDSTTKNWTTYGTDGGAVTNRTATVIDGDTSISGTPVAPSAGNNWGFSFSNLTNGHAVTLVVSVTDTTPATTNAVANVTIG